MKEAIRDALGEGEYVSGEQLGKVLGVSRSAVWESIKQLRREGYHIDSSSRKGYRLVRVPDRLFPLEIGMGLKTQVLGRRIVYYPEVSCTQNIARQLAAEGAVEGTVVVAEEQSGGRGRIQRNWWSPPEGIYLSVILRPIVEPSQALIFPLIAGVAVAEAVNEVTGLRTALKWPNDVIVHGKKVAGILIEVGAEIDRTNHIIIGIGVNVNAERSGFPEDIKGRATSLREEYGERVPRVNLVQAILTRLEVRYQDCMNSGFGPVRERWKELSDTIGKSVSITGEREVLSGTAIDVDEYGALILREEDGSMKRVLAGDVSLRDGEEGRQK
ncbi:MAG: biotin--[acetyl-CoA-carboxylase] ligase [Dehalococcoidia bacterium]